MSASRALAAADAIMAAETWQQPPPGMESPPPGMESPVEVAAFNASSGTNAGWQEVQDGPRNEELQRELEVEQHKETACAETQTDAPDEEIPEELAERWFAGFELPAPKPQVSEAPEDAANDDGSSFQGDADGAPGQGGPNFRRRTADDPNASQRSSSSDSSRSSSSSSSSGTGSANVRQRVASSDEEEDGIEAAAAKQAAANAAKAETEAATATGNEGVGAAAQGTADVAVVAKPVPLMAVDPRFRAVADYSDLA